MNAPPGGRHWWRDAVIYEIYVRSFSDSDGDGIGDLPGIRARLGHVAALGADGVWLTPFYPSPFVDGGYDVADYRDVDPRFGTLDDFDGLVADAHELGLRVLVDIVPNHTSSWHPWFRAALRAGPGSAERARYLFADGRGRTGELPPNDWSSVFGGPAWSRVTEPDGRPGQWYLHMFTPQQPDLNWRDPRVPDEFADILRFWLDRGVDGFRVDVAMGLFKQKDLPDAGDSLPPDRPGYVEPSPAWNRPEVHDVYRHWRTILDSYPGERIAVAEAWTADAESRARYVRSDELHQAFNFSWLLAPWSAESFRAAVEDSLRVVSAGSGTMTWVLSSHDAVRQVTRYGGGAVGLRRAHAALLATLALPGSVYLYQGEELGLPEVTDLPDDVRDDPVADRSGGTGNSRDGCRVPIPWCGEEPPYGFAPAGSVPWLPMPPEWGRLTVERQESDPTSTLTFYREALRLRRQCPGLGRGSVRLLDRGADVFAFAREHGFVCVLNCGDEPAPLPRHERMLLASSPLDGSLLPPDTAVWLRTGSAG